MQWLQATSANRFNRLRGERGHLLQGRYKALVVEEGDALGQVCYYLHLNPVRASVVPVSPEALRNSGRHSSSEQAPKDSVVHRLNVRFALRQQGKRNAGECVWDRPNPGCFCLTGASINKAQSDSRRLDVLFAQDEAALQVFGG